MQDKFGYIHAIGFLSKYIKKYYKNFLCFNIGWIGNSFLKIYIPITLAIMIDEIVYYGNMDSFVGISVVFAVMIIFSCLLYYFSEAHHCFLTLNYTVDIKKDVLDKLLIISPQYMSQKNVGDFVNTLQSYTNDCMFFVIRNVIHFINGIFFLVLNIVYVFILGWEIGLVVMVVVTLSFVTSYIIGKNLQQYANEYQKEHQEYVGWLFDILNGFRQIRLLSAQNTVESKLDSYQNKLIKNNEKNSFAVLTCENILKIISLSNRIVLYIVLSYLSYRGHITIGLLTLIITYYTRITDEIKRLNGFFVEAPRRLSTIKHIRDLFDIPDEKEWPGKEKLYRTNGSIEIDDLEFAYSNEKNVFDNISMKIYSCEKIALCGKNGSGKTTLANMLAGFYIFQKGNIKVDNKNIKDIKLDSLRENIGIVQQEVMVFDGSIKDNLLYADANATESQLIEACKAAGLYARLLELPSGLDTKIGQDGMILSGGEKQRLSIARIYLKKSPIIIFDEATSALDEQTESEIVDQWSKVLEGKTVLVISHNIRPVLMCDRYFVIEGNTIAETGEIAKPDLWGAKFKNLFGIME